MTIRIKADVRLLSLVAPFISKEKTRYYLGGINIEKHPKGGIIMTATDGHRLGTIHDKTGSIEGAKSAIIAIAPALKNYIKGTGKTFYQVGNASYITLGEVEQPEAMGDMVVCACNNAPIDGTFPDWRRVVPKKSSLAATKSISFDHRYVDGFLRALGKNACVTAHFIDDTAPTIFRASTEPDFLGVLMPMRSGVEGAFPKWFDEK